MCRFTIVGREVAADEFGSKVVVLHLRVDKGTRFALMKIFSEVALRPFVSGGGGGGERRKEKEREKRPHGVVGVRVPGVVASMVDAMV